MQKRKLKNNRLIFSTRQSLAGGIEELTIAGGLPFKKMNKKQREKEEAFNYLRKIIEPASDFKLVIAIKSVSQSGMYRRMRVAYKDQDISYYVAQAIGWPYKDTGIGVSGCGIDMTLHLADTLTWALYGKDKPQGMKGNGGGCLDWIIL